MSSIRHCVSLPDETPQILRILNSLLGVSSGDLVIHGVYA